MRRIAILAAALWAALSASLSAQGMAVPFDGLRQDPTLPVEISADRLEVVQETGTAVFSGNVVASQGAMRLTAGRLEVIQAPAGADGAAGDIQRLVASGGVTLRNGAEAAESREAVYSVATGEIVMQGEVLLTQNGSAIAGDRLVVDLTTGRASMEGRVTTVLQTGQGE
jgi:lipopolysaccharide export system protein LptA